MTAFENQPPKSQRRPKFPYLLFFTFYSADLRLISSDFLDELATGGFLLSGPILSAVRWMITSPPVHKANDTKTLDNALAPTADKKTRPLKTPPESNEAAKTARQTNANCKAEAQDQLQIFPTISNKILYTWTTAKIEPTSKVFI